MFAVLCWFFNFVSELNFFICDIWLYTSNIDPLTLIYDGFFRLHACWSSDCFGYLSVICNSIRHLSCFCCLFCVLFLLSWDVDFALTFFHLKLRLQDCSDCLAAVTCALAGSICEFLFLSILQVNYYERSFPLIWCALLLPFTFFFCSPYIIVDFRCCALSILLSFCFVDCVFSIFSDAWWNLSPNNL